MAKGIKLSANVSKQVEDQLTKEVDAGVKGAEKNAKNMTLEVDPKVEAKGLGKVQELIEKAVDKKISIVEEPDTTIRNLNKNLDVLQKKLEKVGSYAAQIKKEAEESVNVKTLIKSNTGYKSSDKVVKTKKDGTVVTQKDIWEQDEEKIKKSRKLTEDQKTYLRGLSKEQKQLNTLKEKELATIQEINEKENKSEQDIIDQYNAAVRLKKIIDDIGINEVFISTTAGKGYEGTSKTSIPKSIIPGGDINSYIENFDLEGKLTKSYKKELSRQQNSKSDYLDKKETKERIKLLENAGDIEQVNKKIEEETKELVKSENALNEQLKRVEQDAMNSVENYLNVADQSTEKVFGKMKKAFSDIATYINSGGDLSNLSNELEKFLGSNTELGSGNKELFDERLKELQEVLKGQKEIQDLADKHYTNGDFISKADTNKIDTEIKRIEQRNAELKDSIKLNEKLHSTMEKVGNSIVGKADDRTSEIGEGEKTPYNNDISVSVVPEVEPEEFVNEITEQLKGHSVKVDVELNSENITEEVKKISELIPDKKEIEVSIRQDETNKEVNKDTSVSDASATSEVKKQNEIQKELKETDEQVQKVMYHYGLLNKNLGGKETHQFGDEITAYAEGKRNGNRGWADGTGTYVTNDATEFTGMQKDELKKFFALDASKLKLYEAHIEEEAQKFYEFQHKLEQFVLALGSGFTGFDDNISDVSSETLYEEAKSVFSKYPKIFNSVFKDFEEFDDFIDEMINLVSESGMNENGFNPKKLFNFKNENGIDDIKTRFLKKLGFQGTDLSGTSYGGIQTGSVIFDVEEAPVIASGKTITEVLEQVGVTAEETKYKVEQVTEAEKELVNISTTTPKDTPKETIQQTTPETIQPTLEGNKQYDNSEEITSMSRLKQEVDKVTTSVDEKTNAFREEEQVVTGAVQREISELERLSGELVSVKDDIEKITSAITTLPKIDFDVDMSKLNIENIDGAAIASFNTFREQLAGLEAQLNVSNLSEKLVHISEAFEKLSKVDNLENLNTKNLKITPITSLAEKAGSITELVEALNKLKECLDGLKNASFDEDYFTGLKLTKANVNNMADMAVALETVGIALQSFDDDAKASLSSINELLGKSEDLKNLSSIIKNPKRTKEVKKEVDNAPSAANINKADNISDNISNGTYKKSLDEVTTRFEKLNDAVIENKSLTDKLKEAYDSLEKANGVENKIQAYKDFKNELTSVQNEVSKLEQKNKSFNLSGKLGKQLEEVQNQYSGMSYLSSSLEALEKKITDIQNKSQEAGADLNGLAQEAKEAFASFNKGVLPSGDFVGNFNNLDEAIEKAKSMVDQYDKVKTELKTPLQVNDNGIAKMTAQVVDLNGELKTLTFVYNDATKSMVKQTTNIRKELSGLPGVIDAVKSKLKDMAVYWTATAFDPYDIINGFREIADVVIDLNTQMTELAKVSGLSIDQLEERFNDWANTAKNLGATISDTISAAADWSRLGYSVDEAEKLAEVSILYKNVGDGIDIDEANESLVSTLQGFQMEASQAESIIDSFNEVSNNFAISSAGIGEALQRSASSFYAANTDLNSAIALATATNSVIQDPTRVGKQHIAYLYSNVMIIKVAILVKSQRWLRPRKDYNICFNF